MPTNNNLRYIWVGFREEKLISGKRKKDGSIPKLWLSKAHNYICDSNSYENNAYHE